MQTMLTYNAWRNQFGQGITPVHQGPLPWQETTIQNWKPPTYSDAGSTTTGTRASSPTFGGGELARELFTTKTGDIPLSEW